MLAVTDQAVDAIKRIAPGEAGLRLVASTAPDDVGGALHVEIAEEPLQGDEVLEVEGARVYLEPTAATLLDDKVLDAMIEGTSVRFALAEQR